MIINNQGNGFHSLNTNTFVNEDKTRASVSIEKNENIDSLVTGIEQDTNKPSKEEKSLKAKKEALENQVAESKDGDTLQLSKPSLSKYETKKKELLLKKDEMTKEDENIVLKENTEEIIDEKAEKIREEIREAELRRELRVEEFKTELAKDEEREEILKDSVKKEAPETVSKEISFAGKSDNDIAKMFLRGDISKAEYDSEIESRESEREVLANKESEFTKNLLEGYSGTKEFQRFEKEIELAFSKEDNHKISAKDRLAAIEAAAGELISKKEKELQVALN